MRGASYIQAIRANQDRCELETEMRLTEVDAKIPSALESLGDVVSLMEQFGTCSWGCKGGNHLMERFAARAMSYALASKRLLWMGHYDEAYALIRNLGELANLLMLFAGDPAALPKWKEGSDVLRRKEFSAVAVRRQLEAAALPQVLNRSRFDMLSSRFAHSGQIPVAQLHNPEGRMTTGGHFQPGGLSYGMAQLVVFVATIALCLAQLAELSAEHRNEISTAGGNLMDSMMNTGSRARDDA